MRTAAALVSSKAELNSKLSLPPLSMLCSLFEQFFKLDLIYIITSYSPPSPNKITTIATYSGKYLKKQLLLNSNQKFI